MSIIGPQLLRAWTHGHRAAKTHAHTYERKHKCEQTHRDLHIRPAFWGTGQTIDRGGGRWRGPKGGGDDISRALEAARSCFTLQRLLRVMTSQIQ